MTEEAQAPAPAEQSSIPADAGTTPEQPVATSDEQSAPSTEAKADATGDKPKAPSRREALEKAFKSLDDTPKADDEGQPRGPDGKFLPREATDKSAEAVKPEEAPKPADEGRKPVSEAPARFSPDAKAAWKDAPEAVRGEINRAISELEGGIRQYQQVLAPLKPFADMAQKSGTTLDAALSAYVNMENTLRQNPAQGLRALAQNLGMTPADMAALLTGQQVQGNDKDREIVGLRQEINGLKQQLGQLGQSFSQTREQAINENVAKFAADHPRFDELSTEIVRLLETGYASDLADAYTKAERLNPLPQPAITPPAPAPQKRPALSVTGAPNAGSNPGQGQPSTTRTEALSRAFQRAGLA
jgi:hypothetical protein